MRLPRRPGRLQDLPTRPELPGQPGAHINGLGPREGADAVDEHATRRDQPCHSVQQPALKGRQPADVFGPDAPAGVRTPAQRTQPAAGRID